ncbi:hypothetical protein EBQ34_06290 [Vandammella animalimorsus]|uniref:Uncharacterized protein n=1 Tax=Vandammella animalimorsus TaxID=2029117 RepID=A0A3M6RLI9_9BURK|nr:hypothetical protein [Vandammella animalimorsus]RMX15714.1 hypothetical protein EBQ34_06290 [Vandammella animalimorsus]
MPTPISSPATPVGEPLLEQLARQAAHKSPFWLLDQLHQQLQAQQAQGPLQPAWQGWWDLLRFCLGRQSIALWLAHERAALQRIQALAALAGQEMLADILSQALQGQAQPPLTITFSQLGHEDLHFNTQATPQEHFDGQDWAGTDAAIDLHGETFAHTVAQLLRDELAELPWPAAITDADATTAAAAGGAADAHAPQPQATQPAQAPQDDGPSQPPALRAITQAHPRLALQALADGASAWLPMQHHSQPAPEPDLLEFYQALWGAPLAGLLAAYASHNGARLFCHGDTVGLELFAIEQWPQQQARMLQAARQHGWPEQPGALPDWLHSAVCFAQCGMEREYWILPTQGPLAGCVLLSETDALAGHRRFADAASFFQALLHAPARILGASGNLRYRNGAALLEPRVRATALGGMP